VPVLRPITVAEFAAWRDLAIPDYADEQVRAGQWSRDAALALARRALDALLPQGLDTPDHELFSVLDAAGRPVGTLWFAVQARGEARVAYVYDIVIDAGHRRQGHAERAFAALEQEAARRGLAGIALHVFGHNRGAQALYAKLGFVPTNIHLFKPLAPASGPTTSP